MRGTLCELKDACDAGVLSGPGKVLPLIIAGDLFDTPKTSPGLISLAWECLPKEVYVVAGQHDLPNHSLEELDESSLGLLVNTGRVEWLSSHTPTYIGGNVALYGVSWKQSVRKAPSEQTCVAVIHRYCWNIGNSFPGCPEEDHIDQQRQELENLGYTSACWGDNHKGFWTGSARTSQWVNCGVAIPRNADFKDYRPHYYYLLSDGSFEPVPFETEHNWQPWTDQEDMKESSEKLLAFTKEVAKLVGDQSKENFLDELEAAMRNLDDEAVRKKVWAVIQSATGALAK